KGGRDGSVDYLIITSDALISSGVFDPLLTSREERGLTTRITSVAWIEANYDGRDTQEQIRNYIKDLYLNEGLIYVLLGGDTNIVPDRKAYSAVDGRVPCDMYYSDLDGDWDDDGDDVFGEPSDNIDLYPDVFVGRAPVENQTEAAAFVNKTLTFESKSFADYDYNGSRALFMAVEMPDWPYDGGETKDSIDANIMPDRFKPIMKLYERNGELNHDNAMGSLELGYYLVNHIEHANIDVLYVGDDTININDINNLSNAPYFSILWSCGCFPAAIDYNCIAEHWVTNPNGGGAVFIGNSRHGLHPESDTMLDPAFYASLFFDQIYHVGETLADSKITFISQAQASLYMRHAMFELNLLGDPALEIDMNMVISVPNDYPTIQGAIDVAYDGDTILVTPGVYDINEPIYFMGKTITLKSRDGPEATIIRGNNSEKVITFDGWEGPDTIIDGFTIKNGYTTNTGGGIYCIDSSPTIKNNIITNNNAGFGAGIGCLNNASPTIINNTITDNTADYEGGGIDCYFSSPVITNNIITENTSNETGGGITCYNASPTITNNIIDDNSAVDTGGGIDCRNLSSPEIINNTIVNNAAISGGGLSSINSTPTITNSILWFNEATNEPSIYFEGSSPTVSYSNVEYGFSGTGNIHDSPLFTHPGARDYHLGSQSPCIDVANGEVEPQKDFDGEERYDDADVVNGGIGTPVYVDMGVFERQTDSNPAGSIIRVPQDRTTIQHAINDGVNGDLILVSPGTYNPIDFMGKNITVQSTDGPKTTIISGDQTSYAVVFQGGENSNAVLDGFTITNGHGGIHCTISSPTIINNIITENSDYEGGGIYGYGSSSTIKNNIIVENSATGTGSSGGGIYFSYSNPTLINNIIIRNTAGAYGGGIHLFSSSATITNNTITLNSANNSGAGIYCYDSSPAITNTIIWGNSAPSSPNIRVFGNSNPTVRYCAIQGGWSGADNINADPRFLNAFGSDYYDFGLKSHSPCIDAANGDEATDEDFDNKPRFNDRNVSNTGVGTPEYTDIGAWERQIHSRGPGPEPKLILELPAP
ncbi:MAG: C25 family cysteine peptidase, partial [bacterium]